MIDNSRYLIKRRNYRDLNDNSFDNNDLPDKNNSDAVLPLNNDVRVVKNTRPRGTKDKGKGKAIKGSKYIFLIILLFYY
jgi:hypothetical protein